MNNPEVSIPEDIAPQVLALASQYYAHSTQSYSVSELVQAGAEVQIPAEFLVSITQAYVKHEQELVSVLVKSREAYLQAVTPNEKAAAIAKVNQAIKRFGDYAAANPQLQSSQLFINLQYEIAGTENRIAVERMRYNKAVQSYNQQIQQFPNSVLAQAFGFKSKSFFQTTTTSVTKTSMLSAP
jgi:hypothetical protein